MSNTALINITGIKAVQQSLAGLPSLLVARLFHDALERGGGVIQGEVETRVPEAEGDLAEHVKMVIELDPQRGGGRALIGFDSSVNEEGFPYDAIALWVEYGHHEFVHGKDTGKEVPAHPFMRPAAVAASERAAEVFVETLIGSIESLGNI